MCVYEKYLYMSGFKCVYACDLFVCKHNVDGQLYGGRMCVGIRSWIVEYFLILGLLILELLVISLETLACETDQGKNRPSWFPLSQHWARQEDK